MRVEALALVVLLFAPAGLDAGESPRPRDYWIAARYAPDFRQVVDRRQPRLDYITRFDFDANWRADDNWQNVADPAHPLPANIYFAVAETRTHFFIHYVYFHPRDWKGGRLGNGGLQLLKFAARPLVFPRWLGLEALSLAHENDLEGALVVVERESAATLDGRVVLVESFSHYRFRACAPEESEPAFAVKPKPLEMRAGRPVLFIESKGHGVRERLEPKSNQTVVEYRYAGRAEEPVPGSDAPVGYELVSLHDTLWQRAREDSSDNHAFAHFRSYDQFELSDFFDGDSQRIGTALNGHKRGRNRAAPPWAWKNNGLRGQWFFDPARNIAQRYRPHEPFDTRYLFNRFLALEVAGAASSAGSAAPSSSTH